MKLHPAPWQKDAALHKLFALFIATEHEIRLVGGCVRDALMDRPMGDSDCATTALPQQVVALAKQAGYKAIPTGIDHGTVSVVIDGTAFEITTLRSDIACNGRHAEVVFGTDWQADAQRRDFTCNALYADLDGTIHDYVGGVEDARARRFRFIGDPAQRIAEDGLRILRYFRFLATHGDSSAADEGALRACQDATAMLQDLSGERIVQEMRKLLGATVASDALALMQSYGVLEAIALPDSYDYQAMQRLEQDAPADWVLRLALLCSVGDAPTEVAQQVIDRWKLSRVEQRALLSALMPLPLHADSSELEQKTLLRQIGREAFIAQLFLRMAHNPAQQKTYRGMIVMAQSWDIPHFPVTGKFLMEAGHAAGPELGKKLAQLEAQWEASGYVLSADELLALA